MSLYLLCESFYLTTKREIKKNPQRASLPIYSKMFIYEAVYVQPEKNIKERRRKEIEDLKRRFLSSYYSHDFWKPGHTEKVPVYAIPENVFFKVYVSITPLQDNRTQGTYPPSIRSDGSSTPNGQVLSEMIDWYNKHNKKPISSD